MTTLQSKLAEIEARANQTAPGMSMALNKEHLIKLLYEEIAALKADNSALLKALKLALYYVEGDATYEALCEQILAILEEAK